MNGPARRERLQRARLLLIFTPDLAKDDGALGALAACIRSVDIVQVRPKTLGPGVTAARAAYRWCQAVIEVTRTMAEEARPLVMVNDRVDVAAALQGEGVDGVHVGDQDTPPGVARALLGPDMLIGLSTHTAGDVARAFDEPVDMLGFGPVFPTATKGYGLAHAPAGSPSVVGPEAAWVAAESALVPVFPIGGIDHSNADQLDRVGRAAVGSGILGASDAGAAAASLRELLEFSE